MYRVQQAVFGFWWVDCYTTYFTDYEKAKECLAECASEYEQIKGQRVISVVNEADPKRTWDCPSTTDYTNTER